MADLQAKYHRLASEYAKLKAQIPVLKKAVLDEQTAQEKLKEIVKEKDQFVRKYEQEVDSLTFRNQQLSKRVLILQEELDQASWNKKKNKHKGNDSASVSPENLSDSLEMSVIGEELQNKITENAQLHKQVFESQQEYEAKLCELREKVANYEKEYSQHQQVLNVTRQQTKGTVDRLQQEKAILEVKLQTQETQTKDFKAQVDIILDISEMSVAIPILSDPCIERTTETVGDRLHKVESVLEAKLNIARKIINENLPFIDTRVSEYNGLNLPTHNRKHQLRAKDLMVQAVNLTGEFVQALSNYFAYSEQRARLYPADGTIERLTIINSQYAKHLHEHAPYLRQVGEALCTFNSSIGEYSFTTLETATDLQKFASKFKQLVAYINKLLPYQVESLEQECALSTCTSTLETKNRDLCKSFKRVNSAFNKVESYISILAAQSEKSCVHLKTNHVKFFSLLSKSITDLHDAIKDLSKHFNSKISMEHQLPTATQNLKVTDECIVSSLVSLVTCTGKLSAYLAGNQDFFCEKVCYRTRGGSFEGCSDLEDFRINPIIVQYRQDAGAYLASIQGPLPESIPHMLAVQNRKILVSSTESTEGLSKQITAFQGRINKLEQDKEHYMLELQLLEMKYDNEIIKVKQLERKVQNLTNSESVTSITDNLEDLVVEESAATKRQLSGSATSMLGQPAVDMETREQLIKDHLTNRINKLSQELQLAESKVISFHSEVRALHKRLLMAEKVKENSQEELKQANQNLALLKDELSTTTCSYEGQLRMMSEHLAGMNEKLAQQKDEIDELKLQLSSMVKGQKKTRK